MEKNKLNKLKEALESAGFGLMRFEEYRYTNLWADLEPNDEYGEDQPEPRTYVSERVIVELRTLPLTGQVVQQ